jgi:serine/threonine-protein kinase RsbW
VNAPLEERSIGGLGIYMVKKSMDEVKYAHKEGHNLLTLIKNF